MTTSKSPKAALFVARAYAEVQDPGTTPQRAAELRAALLVYCNRDTQAMVEILGHSAELPLTGH